MSTNAIREHWNSRASLGVTAGTQDLILKQLEQRALLHALAEREVHSVLEIGCGRGELARLIVERFPGVDYLAVDSAPGMILAAKATPYPTSRLRFLVRDVADLPQGHFDVILTERLLINLPTWDLQRRALTAIAERLNPGGVYLMCEHSHDGLAALNAERQAVGLPVMQPPWHNRYLTDAELATVTDLRLLRCEPFSSTYYFLSRVVNAWQAHRDGREPQYDAPINQLALSVSSVGPWAQGRLWIWVKP